MGICPVVGSTKYTVVVTINDPATGRDYTVTIGDVKVDAVKQANGYVASLQVANTGATVVTAKIRGGVSY